jgi:hypothetical protein
MKARASPDFARSSAFPSILTLPKKKATTAAKASPAIKAGSAFPWPMRQDMRTRDSSMKARE